MGVTTLAQAIARLENTNPVYNNPGAISGTGDTGSSFGQGIGIYSNLAAGQAALENQVNMIYSGNDPLYPGGSSLSLDQFGEIYAPNQNYGSSIAKILGVPSSTPLSAISSGTSSSDSSSGFSLKSMLANLATGGVMGNPLGKGSASSIFGHSLEDIVTILVGVLLIAAGLFAFKNTQVIVQTAGRVARTATEAVAA